MNIKKSLLAIALTLLTGCTGLKEFNEKLANINNKLGGTSQSTTNANEKKVINLIDTTKSKYGEFKKFELIQDKEGYWSFSFEYVNKTNTPHILELITVKFIFFFLFFFSLKYSLIRSKSFTSIGLTSFLPFFPINLTSKKFCIFLSLNMFT